MNTTTKQTQKEQDYKHATSILWDVKEYLQREGVVVVTIKSTSKSNMSFAFDMRLYYFDEESEQVKSLYLNWMYATLMGMTQNKYGEIKGNGIGIDRAFEASNNLQYLISSIYNENVYVRYESVF